MSVKRLTSSDTEYSFHGACVDESKLNVIGLCFDGTACFRKGARKGPVAIRENLEHIESYSPYLNMDLEDYQEFNDLGDIHFLPEPIDYSNKKNLDTVWNQAQICFDELFENTDFKKCKLLSLGGEHSVSIAPIKRYLKAFSDLHVLHLDAHADLRDEWTGFSYSHASIIRRCVERFGPKHSLLQYGIRSGTKEEFVWMKENETRYESLNELIQGLENLSDKTPIYLTLDLDFLDPSVFPGTGTPEAGGESYHNLIKIFKRLNDKNLVGADIVELAPELDSSGISSVLASNVFRELALILGSKL